MFHVVPCRRFDRPVTPTPAAMQGSPRTGTVRRRGAYTAELAVIAPVFFLMMFGIIEFGRGFMVTELLNDAARIGCRKGIVEGTTTQQIKDAATNYLTSVGISGDTANVTIADGVGNVTEAQNVPAYTEITVQVTVPVTSITWVPGAFFPKGTLSGQWTMLRE